MGFVSNAIGSCSICGKFSMELMKIVKKESYRTLTHFLCKNCFEVYPEYKELTKNEV